MRWVVANVARSAARRAFSAVTTCSSPRASRHARSASESRVMKSRVPRSVPKERQNQRMLEGVLAHNAEPGPTDRAADDALLVYPPFVATSVNGPHLALGVLSAYLKTRGKKLSVWDGNIRFVRGLLDTERLESKLSEQRDEFRALDEEPELDWDEYIALKRSAAAFDVPAEIAAATRGDNDAAFGVLAKILGSLYGESLAEILRSTDAVVDALENDEPCPELFAEFLATQDAFFERARQVGLVGINVSFSEQLHFAVLIARELERRFGEKRPLILLGGTQISLLAASQIKRLLELPFIDGIAVYEGELTLEQAILATQAALAAGNAPKSADLSRVPNLWTRGRQKLDAFAEAIAPNDLPTPSFEPEDLRLYYAPLVLPVFVTKGCYWGKCTFCDYTKLAAPSPKRWVEREVDKVVADLKVLLARHTVTTFHTDLRRGSSALVPAVRRRRDSGEARASLLLLSQERTSRSPDPGVLLQTLGSGREAAHLRRRVSGRSHPERDREGHRAERHRSELPHDERGRHPCGVQSDPRLPLDPLRRGRGVDPVRPRERRLHPDAVLSVLRSEHRERHRRIARDVRNHGRRSEAQGLEARRTHALIHARNAEPGAARVDAYGFSRARRYGRALPRDQGATLRAPQPDFDWARSSFMFRPFARVESHFSNEFAWDDLLVRQASEKQIWLRQRKLGTEIALPAKLSEFVDLMQRHTFVTFDSLIAAAGLDRESLTELLSRLTRLGFVEKVLAFGPATLDRELESLFGRLGSASRRPQTRPGKSARGLREEAPELDGGRTTQVAVKSSGRFAIDVESVRRFYESDVVIRSFNAGFQGRWHTRVSPDVPGIEDSDHYVCHLLGLGPKHRALDFGCGAGVTTCGLATRTGGRFRGLNVSPKQVELANDYAALAGLSERVAFDCYPGKKFPYGTGSFDRATFFESPCHVPHKPLLFEELFRVLKPGGACAGQDWMLASDDLSKADYESFIRPIEQSCEVTLLSLAGYRRLMERAGFVNVRTIDGRDLDLELARGFTRPSSQRIRVSRRDNLATRLRLGNVALSNAFHKGLFTIGFIYGEKPPARRQRNSTVRATGARSRSRLVNSPELLPGMYAPEKNMACLEFHRAAFEVPASPPLDVFRRLVERSSLLDARGLDQNRRTRAQRRALQLVLPRRQSATFSRARARFLRPGRKRVRDSGSIAAS